MSKKFDNLQALRGVACLMVVLFHLAGWEEEYGLRTSPVREAKAFGFAGVDLFFVLSGFIITHTNRKSLGQSGAAPGYLFRRLWRIYPPFWAAMVLVGLAWVYLLKVEVLSPGWERDWLRWMLLLPGEPLNGYIAPAWTLAYEVMFYLAFTLLFLAPPRLGWLLLAGWGAAVLALIPLWRPDQDPYLALAISPFVLEFLGGCVVAWLLGRGVTRFGRSALVLGVAWAAGAAVVAKSLSTVDWMTLMATYPVRVAVFGPAATLVVYALAAREAAGGRAAPRWLQRIGDGSYSIYLLHCAVGWLAVIYGCLMPHSKAWHMAWLAGTSLACVVVGMAFHYAVERPLLHLVKGRRKAGPPVVPVPTPPPTHPATEHAPVTAG